MEHENLHKETVNKLNDNIQGVSQRAFNIKILEIHIVDLDLRTHL